MSDNPRIQNFANITVGGFGLYGTTGPAFYCSNMQVPVVEKPSLEEIYDSFINELKCGETCFDEEYLMTILNSEHGKKHRLLAIALEWVSPVVFGDEIKTAFDAFIEILYSQSRFIDPANK